MKTAIALVAGLTAAASAADYNGAGFVIPDNSPAGASSSIVIGDAGNLVDLNITLNDITHTWVGDLIITLSNGSTSVDLVNRPGVPDQGTVGWAYNLNGDYTFDDAAGTTNWDNVNGGVQDSAFTIGSGSYIPFSALSAFNGASLAGTWTLSISDNAGLDTGALGGWTLSATVPTPSSMALLGLGGLVATRRRR